MYYFLNWNWNLHWNDDLLFNFNNLWYFNSVVNNLFHFNISWNFFNDFNYLLYDCFVIDDSFLSRFELNNLVNYPIDDLFNLDEDILFNNYFHDFFLNDRLLNYFFHLFDSFFYDDLRDNSFYNLWYFDHLFDNSRDNDNPLYNLFDFNYFWNFDHLFNDLFNRHLNLLDSVDMSNDLNDFFFDIFDWLRYFNVMINNPLNLDRFRFSNNDWISNLNDDWNLPLMNLN